MEEHPIEGLMLAAMDSIRDMIEVDTIIGDTIQVQENVNIIPISKVSFGFAAGGSEFKGESIEDYKRREDEENISYRNPFGGGSGAGVSIKPVAFLVVQGENVKLLPVEHNCTIDRIIDYMPELCEKAEKLMDKLIKKDENKEEVKIQKPKIKKVGIDYKYDYKQPEENSKD
jgi:sporulation protein YtfJ